METYTIKPLEWVEFETHATAITPVGTILVYDSSWVCHYGRGFNWHCTSRDHGKERAWEWYKAKLGEALTRVD